MAKKFDLDALSTDEMWQLHNEIAQVLSVRLTSEKRELEKRLAQLRREKTLPQAWGPDGISKDHPRRSYPRVLPKYQNPSAPFETWSGRGKQPRWLMAALKAGHSIDDFIITAVEPNKGKSRQRHA
jgi:DNA-binding protein H-NS